MEEVSTLPLLGNKGDSAKLQEFTKRLEASNKQLRMQIALGKEAAEVERVLEQARRKGIKIDDDVRARIKDLVKINQQLKLQAGFVSEVARGFAGAINAGLQDAVFEGKKLKDVLGSILETMAKIAIQAALVKPLTNAFEIGLGKLSANAGSLFAAAHGGISPGGVTLVGEKGPELVDLPKGARVTPNNALGGLAGGRQTIVNIQNFSGERTETRRTNDAQGNELINVIVGEIDKRIANNGSTGQTMARVFGLQRNGIVRT